ncbi:MAG: hypothetical protein NTW14_03130 [bacterium]|nr:hypothetical protein [bacterium]
MKSSLILILVLVGFSIAFSTTSFGQTKNDKEDSTSVRSPKEQEIYDLKRDMLLSELQTRSESQANAESILYQIRLALITVLVGFLIYLFERCRDGQGKVIKAWIPPTKWAVWGVMILAFFMYWSDGFILELQNRQEARVGVIVKTLDALPSMSTSAIEKLKVFPSLQQNDLPAKFCILFPPNFAQVVSYAPLGLVLGFLIYTALKKK